MDIVQEEYNLEYLVKSYLYPNLTSPAGFLTKSKSVPNKFLYFILYCVLNLTSTIRFKSSIYIRVTFINLSNNHFSVLSYVWKFVHSLEGHNIFYYFYSSDNKLPTYRFGKYLLSVLDDHLVCHHVLYILNRYFIFRIMKSIFSFVNAIHILINAFSSKTYF